MSKEIEVKVAEEQIESAHIKVSPYGITFDGSPSIKEWHQAVLGVQKVHGMMQFYLGDLMVYAESPVTGWGESKYDVLIENTGYDYKTLARFAQIARKFSIEFREEIWSVNAPRSKGVSFEHFKEVQSLDFVPAKYFLEQARDQMWTVARLREEVIKFKNHGILPEKDAPEEKPIGMITFKEIGTKFFKGYVPSMIDREYDEQSWLLEVRDVIDERLHDLGIEG